jgi:uncharacterized protein YqeY
MKTQIKNQIKVAMKNGHTIKRDILRVLMGEIERREQTSAGHITLTDEMITSLIKKMVANIRETTDDLHEIIILSEYLPTTLSEDEVVVIIAEVMDREGIDSMRGLGTIMKEFSIKYKNQYDGKEVSAKIREMLS